MLALGARGYLSWKRREFVAFPPPGKKPKWLILGWDAADWDVILAMMQRGALPTLSRFLAEGAHGRLATLNPPLSPMLWTSVATGRRAYEHGILGFTESDPETGNLRAVRGSSRRTRAFWNILEDHGHTANVLGWWPSHPAEKLKGAMVSNFFQIIPEKGKEGLNVESVQPEFIRPEMDSLRMHPSEVTSAMLAPFFPEAPGLDSKEDGKVRSVMKILSQAVSIHNTSTWLLENKPSDIQAVYFDAIDHLCHLAMAYHPPKQKHIDPDDFRKYHFIVEAGYRFHDMMLERYLDLTHGETNILILSDHGFRSGNHRLSSLPEHPGAPALDHTPYGMIAAMGPDIKPGEIHGASLLDIFPTILQAFDLPLPEDIPGRSLQELFRSGKRGGSVPTYEKTPLSLPTDKGGVDQEVLKQLADIGYLDPDQVPMGRSGEITPENRVNLARSLADAGKWKEAISEMKTACSILPNSPWILEELGMIAWQAGNVAELEETIKRLQELAPDSRWLIFFKGVHSMILGRP
ncbi:MAG: alkaline phosphatase family protein, partial [Bacteroidota bacterium]|nr:alkaline phosphatase family protein [Bacteroidota bacterium]